MTNLRMQELSTDNQEYSAFMKTRVLLIRGGVEEKWGPRAKIE